MSESEFQGKVLNKLGSIESNQNTMYDELRTQQDDIKDLRDKATQAFDSAKSAHHRINTLYAIGGLVASIIAYFMSQLQR